MRPWTPLTRASLAIAATMTVAGCNLEVNINLGEDDTAPATVPEVFDPAPATAPEVRDPASARTSGAIRDALFRPEAPPEPRLPSLPRLWEPGVERSPPSAGQARGILNRQQILSVLHASYPPLLRDAGIGGTVSVFFLVAGDGTVQDVHIDESSGYTALDDAALAVARVYRFTPVPEPQGAEPAWLSLPIYFRVR